jgi:DNA polymerase III subunit gamma/tau
VTALYRKYRPLDFDEVVGQEPVVRTLRNAIERDQVRQAYLFAGPRGTGKTSLARILAKSLNCEKGPTPTPCKQCESCLTIAAGTSLDVVEMDAASQRGIDDVREIRERVIVQPAAGRRKIYILDEAHQLTDAAFNALLKLIEEPPPHLVFIFCTTDVTKMIPTVRSRCQTFRFERPRLGELTRLLRRVVEGESIEAPDSALALIARSARGSFRDAVSTLDQIASATNGTVTVQAVLELLGAVEEDALFRLCDLVIDRDPAGTLAFVEELAEQGQDMGRLVTDLLEHLRHLMLVQHTGDVPDTIPATEETRDRLRAQANQLGDVEVLRLIDLLALAVEEIREGGDPRLPLELALVKVTRPQADRSRDALLLRLEQLEARVGAVGAATAGRPEPSHAAAVGTGHAPPLQRDPPAEPFATSTSSEDVGAGHEPPNPLATDEAAAEVSLDLEQLQHQWRQAVLPALEERSIPAASMLREAWPVDLTETRVVIEFPPHASFHRDLAEEPKNAGLLRQVLHEVTGLHLVPTFALGAEEPGIEGENLAETPATEEDIVTLLKQTFDAREVGDD